MHETLDKARQKVKNRTAVSQTVLKLKTKITIELKTKNLEFLNEIKAFLMAYPKGFEPPAFRVGV